ncbi:MAG: universal stress protein [Planctomycetaceae bacterium]|nr:universal stress protein [Planctomycetaceae bacterium]
MIKLKRILVPTDFSDFSKHALRYGCEFARRFSAELHLLNVVENIYPIVAEPGMAMPAAGEYLADLQKSAEQAIEQFPQPDWAEGIPVTRTVQAGTPFLEVIRYAKDMDIDLIVIGTHGRSGLVHVLMGSVAEKVVRKSPCPVLTVRPEGHDFVMP